MKIYFNKNTFVDEIKKGIISKKFGEPNFIIPFTDQYARVLDEHITSLAKSNLSWIKHNPEALESLISLHQKYEYDTQDMLDLDASLYENGFFKTDEVNMMKTFHNKNITDKQIQPLLFVINKYINKSIRSANNIYGSFLEFIEYNSKSVLFRVECEGGTYIRNL